nr:mucin-12-like [Rhipicephalus microplus]
MDVLVALFLLSSPCTAVPLRATTSANAINLQGSSSSGAGLHSSTDGRLSTFAPPTKMTKSANDASLLAADSTTAYPRQTSILPAFVHNTPEESFTVHEDFSLNKTVGSRDAQSSSNDNNSTIASLVTQTSDDLLSYELSSLKNKSGDRWVGTFPGGMPSVEVTTVLPSQKEPRLAGKSSVVKVHEAPSQSVVKQDLTTSLPITVPSVTTHSQFDNEDLQVSAESLNTLESTSHFLPSASSNVTTHNYSTVQSLFTTAGYAVSANSDVLDITATPETSTPLSQNVNVQAPVPTQTKISESSKIVDIEIQLKSLVSTQGETIQPSTPSFTPPSFFSSHELQSVTLNKSSLSETPLPVDCTSVNCTEQSFQLTPWLPSVRGSSDMTPASSVEHSAALEQSISYEPDDRATLPLENTKTSTLTELPIPEYRTVERGTYSEQNRRLKPDDSATMFLVNIETSTPTMPIQNSALEHSTTVEKITSQKWNESTTLPLENTETSAVTALPILEYSEYSTVEHSTESEQYTSQKPDSAALPLGNNEPSTVTVLPILDYSTIEQSTKFELNTSPKPDSATLLLESNEPSTVTLLPILEYSTIKHITELEQNTSQKPDDSATLPLGNEETSTFTELPIPQHMTPERSTKLVQNATLEPDSATLPLENNELSAVTVPPILEFSAVEQSTKLEQNASQKPYSTTLPFENNEPSTVTILPIIQHSMIEHSTAWQKNTSQKLDNDAIMPPENTEASTVTVLPILEYTTVEHSTTSGKDTRQESDSATVPLGNNETTTVTPLISLDYPEIDNTSVATFSLQIIETPAKVTKIPPTSISVATSTRAHSSEPLVNVATQIVNMPTEETTVTKEANASESYFDTFSLAPTYDKATVVMPSQGRPLPATSRTSVAVVLSTSDLGDTATRSEMPDQDNATEYGEASSTGTGKTAGVTADTATTHLVGEQVHPESMDVLDLSESTSAEHLTPWEETDAIRQQLETLLAIGAITESSVLASFPYSSSEELANTTLEVTTTLPANSSSPAGSEPVSPRTPAIAPEGKLTSPYVEQSTTEKGSVFTALPSEMPRHGSTENSTLSVCVPLEPPRRPSHEFRLVFNTSAEFSWEQVEALEKRIQHFSNDSACPRHFARTAFTLGPPHELSWTDPSANASWCDNGAVDTLLQAMRTHSGHPTPEVTRAFYPEFKVVAVELHYRGACTDRRGIASFPVVATAIGAVLAAALIAGLVLWRALRLVPSRSRKLNVTSQSSAVPRESFYLKQRRPVLLTGENRAGSTNGTPSKSPHTKPNPPFVVDTDFCYINPNFLEVVKQSPPPPPPYRKSLDRRSLDAMLPAPPPRPLHGPHSTLGSRRRAEQDEGSSSSGVESDAQPSGEAKSNESS